MIYFGGNAEDVAGSAAGLADVFADHAVYLLHYPGYGGAPGEPSEAAIAADALALFDRVACAASARRRDRAAAWAAASRSRWPARRPVARLVLVTPYDSLAGDRGDERYPVCSGSLDAAGQVRFRAPREPR